MACWDCLCCFTVQESEVRIVENLGKFNRVAQPGCRMYNCFTEQALAPFSMRYQYINVHVQSMTKDKVHINVEVCVHYRVKTGHGEVGGPSPGGAAGPGEAAGQGTPLMDGEMAGMDDAQKEELYVKKAYYALSNPSQQLMSWTESLVRGCVPEYTIDGLYAARDKIARDLQRDLEQQVGNFGYTIYTVLLCNMEPSPDTKHSMNEVNRQRRLREAMKYNAEADAKARVLHAEAEMAAQEQSGIGLAEQRKAVVQGLQQSIQGFHDAVHDVDPKEVMMLLLMNQYFDTLKEIAEKSFTTSVFTPDAEMTTGRVRDANLQATAAHEHGIGAAGGQRGGGRR